MEEGVFQDVLRLLDDVLGLAGRSRTFTSQTPLLGALPELDSIAVIGLLTALEERFGVTIADDEIDGSVFATVGSFSLFVQNKLDA
jgi:acyl carrier protein